MNINYRWILGGFAGVLVLFYALAIYWSYEPEIINARTLVSQQTQKHGENNVIGYATTSMLIYTTETMLDKPGGFLSNDVMPPGVMMDNIPSWEFGALEMIRDMALAMREDFSRSQSQSVENAQLKTAQPAYNIDHRSLVMPSAESEYRKAIEQMYIYRQHLADPAKRDAQFYARADNLADWLKKAEYRLGSISQRLSASVGQTQLNTDMAGEVVTQQSTATPDSKMLKTSWWQLDNVFYEARGSCWALLHLLKAIELDFSGVLEKKNATVSLRQIIRELEATQATVWSPMVLNGSGFGVLANHSLVMASYVTRANAAISDLRTLMVNG
ncbi:MAG: DUF2333 family protein [Psychrosphaera sp.]|nr:DUF2333 family protein [Psychrosphaera sp.]